MCVSDDVAMEEKTLFALILRNLLARDGSVESGAIVA